MISPQCERAIDLALRAAMRFSVSSHRTMPGSPVAIKRLSPAKELGRSSRATRHRKGTFAGDGGYGTWRTVCGLTRV